MLPVQCKTIEKGLSHGTLWKSSTGMFEFEKEIPLGIVNGDFSFLWAQNYLKSI